MMTGSLYSRYSLNHHLAHEDSLPKLLHSRSSGCEGIRSQQSVGDGLQGHYHIIYIYDNFVGSCFVESKCVLGTFGTVLWYQSSIDLASIRSGQISIWFLADRTNFQLMLITRAMVQHISISTNNIKWIIWPRKGILICPKKLGY